MKWAKLSNSRAAAMVFMTLTSIIVSCSGVIVRSLEEAGPWQINIYRSLSFIAAIVIILCFNYRKEALSRVMHVPVPKPIIWAGLVLGLTGVTITQALTTTTIANTMFTMSAIPFLTSALAFVFLGEKLTKATIVAMLIAMLGIVMMVVDGVNSGSLYGNIMAVLTTIGFATFAVIVRANNDLDMLPALIVGGVVVIMISLVPAYGQWSITLYDLALCAIWGAGLSGLGHLAFVLCSRVLAAAELTLFTLFEFALAPLWVWMLFTETPGTLALVGGCIVIASVAWRAMDELVNFSKP